MFCKKAYPPIVLLILTVLVHHSSADRYLQHRYRRQAPTPKPYPDNNLFTPTNAPGDPVFLIGGIYGDPCSPYSAPCYPPFECKPDGFCDCPDGYFSRDFTCAKLCPADAISINDTCYKVKRLGEKCEINEQCTVPYARCTNGRCQCLNELRQSGNTCSYTPRCLIGQPARDRSGQLAKCNTATLSGCPKGYMCWLLEHSTTDGYCCPDIDIKCPVGETLKLRDGEQVPWATHYQYYTMAGRNARTLYCPYACPPASPVLIDDTCYPRVGFGAPCVHDAQCKDVVYNSICKPDRDNVKRCACPDSRYKRIRSQCVTETPLGGNCTTDMDCTFGSNTYCKHGTCQCFSRFIPMPSDDGKKPTRCIGEPLCPTKNGMMTKLDYVDCSNGANVCGTDEFCKHWWYEPTKNFSLCCKNPGKAEYDAVCQALHMTTQYKDGGDPYRCEFGSFTPLMGLFSKPQQTKICQAGMHCVFNPYESVRRNSGICCKVKGMKDMQTDWLSTMHMHPVGLDDLNAFA